MKLDELLKDIDVIRKEGPGTGNVASICYDSRKCAEGALFVAVPGLKSDGHDFIPAVIASGAKFIVHEKDVTVPAGITAVRVRDSRRALGLLGRNFFRDPSSGLCVVGVTGTNGKTTITYLLESIFEAAGAKAGVIGTINYRYADRIYPAPNTTPESLELQRILREMADAGVTHAVMEVSSHALELGRVADCTFQAGIFTNLTQDHLDYHKTMEDYYRAKKRLFEMLAGGGRGNRAVLNLDDPWGERLCRELVKETGQKPLTYSIERRAGISVLDPSLSVQGISAVIERDGAPGDVLILKSPLIGKFNLYNIAAAVAAACSLGVPGEAIRKGIERVKNIPGRMEKVSLPGEPSVFVDYAHTEDALRRVLQNITEFKKRKIITVFGCGGDRDRGKRPLMGKASVAYSDLTLITSDNPRSEEPNAIIREIEKGINGSCRRYDSAELKKSGFSAGMEKGYVVIPDRRLAIQTAIGLADPSDIVLIAGKGHEDYQIIGGCTTPFDDRMISRELLDGLSQRRSS